MIARLSAEAARRLTSAIERICAIVDREQPNPLPEIAAVVDDLEAGDGPLSRHGSDIACPLAGDTSARGA